MGSKHKGGALRSAEFSQLSDAEFRNLFSRVHSEWKFRFGSGQITSDIAEMSVGETRTFPWTMHHYRRLNARQVLGNPVAQWATRALGNGSTRVTRIR